MKSSTSESKPFLSRSKGEIPGRARRKERLSRSKLKQAFLIDSYTELFMYLIQYIRFGPWKVRRLNRALVTKCVLIINAAEHGLFYEDMASWGQFFAKVCLVPLPIHRTLLDKMEKDLFKQIFLIDFSPLKIAYKCHFSVLGLWKQCQVSICNHYESRNTPELKDSSEIPHSPTSTA